ncbi:unnamed protein product [Urochloa humidicola]
MDRNFLDASLRPPAHDHQPPDEAGAPGSWAMLNVRAYITDRRNATTASCLMSNRGVIQAAGRLLLLRLVPGSGSSRRNRNGAQDHSR